MKNSGAGTRFLSSKSFGQYTVEAGKLKPKSWKKRAANASEAIKWKKSKKQTCVTRAKARNFNAP